MNLFIIRHAPTEANLSGDLVKNYDSFDILPFDVEKWKSKVGFDLPKNFTIFCSPAKRCVHTAELLFPNKEITISDDLREFDCSGLAGKKFWEISEEEFNKCSGLSKAGMWVRITSALASTLGNWRENPDANVVWVTHGLFGRTVYSVFNHTTDTPYELINSTNIQFRNLDMMAINTRTGDTKIYRY